MTEKEYRAYDAINYSLLSKLSVSPVGLEGPKEERSYFTMGSLVDCLCTSPDDFNNDYYVMTVKQPADMMIAYAKEYLKTGKHSSALSESGYKSDPTSVAKTSKDGLSKWQKEGEPYYNALKAGKGKQVVSFEEYTQAEQLAGTLKNNEFTSKYFGGSQNLHQNAIIWEYEGKECKSLLDIIHIDDDNRTIRPMDLKTTGKSVFTFARSYQDYRYYIQAKFYTDALIYAIEHDLNGLGKYKNYTVLPFQFIVIETNYKNPPHIFEVTTEDMTVAEHGGVSATAGYEIKGYKTLINNLEYHNKSNQWDYRQEVYENSGIINLNCLASA